MPRLRLIQAWLLRAALLGLEQSRRRVEGQIAQVRNLLALRRSPASVAAADKPKRTVSRATRKRMAEAQKRRWALAKARAGAKATGKATKKA